MTAKSVRAELAEALRRISDRAQAVLNDAYQSRCENADICCPPGFGLLFWKRWEELERALRECNPVALLARHAAEPEPDVAALREENRKLRALLKACSDSSCEVKLYWSLGMDVAFGACAGIPTDEEVTP